jgi:hypothetical protein
MTYFDACVHPYQFQLELSAALDHLMTSDIIVEIVINDLGIEDPSLKAWLCDLEDGLARL